MFIIILLLFFKYNTITRRAPQAAEKRAARAAQAEREALRALESAKSGNQRAEFQAGRAEVRVSELQEEAAEAAKRAVKAEHDLEVCRALARQQAEELSNGRRQRYGRSSYNIVLLLRFTGPPVPITARVHATPQRPFMWVDRLPGMRYQVLRVESLGHGVGPQTEAALADLEEAIFTIKAAAEAATEEVGEGVRWAQGVKGEFALARAAAGTTSAFVHEAVATLEGRVDRIHRTKAEVERRLAEKEQKEEAELPLKEALEVGCIP
eukprot:8791293-Pyramimonas_sp.AAC.2